MTTIWSAPSSSGGVDILRFTIELDFNEAGTFKNASVTVTANIDAHTFLNLVPGMLYRTRVAAWNQIGIGEFSDPSNAITVAELPETSQVSFEAQFSLDFSEWAQMEQSYKTEMAAKLGVHASHLTATAREGSIVVTTTATVVDTTNASVVIEELRLQAESGNLTLVGASVKAMTTPSALISTGPSISTLSPNIGSTSGVTYVTITGDSRSPFDENTVILYNGNAIASIRFLRRSTYQQAVVALTGQPGLTSIQVGIQKGRNVLPFYQYEPEAVFVSNCTPVIGRLVGGIAGGGAVTVAIERQRHILSLPSFDKSQIRCKFGSETQTSGADSSALLGGVIQCLPPPSSFAGTILVTVSLNGNEQWLNSNASYTYRCNDDEYIDSDQTGLCLSCVTGGRCDGTYDFFPQQNYWRRGTKPFSSPVYKCKFDSCRGGDLPCETGHRGITCAQCEAGYHLGDDGCQPCEGGDVWGLVGLFAVILLATAAALGLRQFRIHLKEQAEENLSEAEDTPDELFPNQKDFDAKHAALMLGVGKPAAQVKTESKGKPETAQHSAKDKPKDNMDIGVAVDTVALKAVKASSGSTDNQQIFFQSQVDNHASTPVNDTRVQAEVADLRQASPEQQDFEASLTKIESICKIMVT